MGTIRTEGILRMYFMKKTFYLLFTIISLSAMQKPEIPRLELPVKEFQEEIIHLDLSDKTQVQESIRRGGIWNWCCEWPTTYQYPDSKNKEKMLAMIESRVKNKQDLHLPVTSINCSDSGIQLQRTIMDYAVHSDDYLEVTKKLLALGVNPNAICFKDSSGMVQYPLQRALMGKAEKTIALLLASPKIDVRIKNNHGSLLWYATIGFKTPEEILASMRQLLDAGVDPNTLDCRGQTVLFDIAGNNCGIYPDGVKSAKAKVELLCEYGLDVNIKNKEGRTAVESIENWYDTETIRNRLHPTYLRYHGYLDVATFIKEEGPAMMMAYLRKMPTHFSLLPKEITDYVCRL